MSLKTRNLTEKIGAEILADAEEVLRPENAARIRELLIERGVLVLRKMHLSDEMQVKLAGMLGHVRAEGENGIYKITLDARANARGEYIKGSFLWHMDGTHDFIPVFATLLSGRVLSIDGGQTSFANSYAAYEDLPDAMEQRIEGLSAVHSVTSSMRRADVEFTPQSVAYWNTLPERTHRLVWTHKSGRKSLVIGCHTSHIVGMDPRESEELLQELLAWTTQPRFVYRHEWSLGDTLIWDNTGVLHRVEPYPLDCGRLMHRTTLLGEEAFA